MPKIVDYSLIEEDTPNQLVEAVKEMMQEGRQPQWGVSSMTEVYTNSDWEVCSTETYLQAMVKYGI